MHLSGRDDRCSRKDCLSSGFVRLYSEGASARDETYELITNDFCGVAGAETFDVDATDVAEAEAGILTVGECAEKREG